jgi:hypothetical protein
VADIDTNTFWSAGAPTRIVVPAGVTKVKITSNVRWSANTTGTRQAVIAKNGATFHGRGAGSNSPNPGGNCDQNVTSAVIPVVAGDYFELLVFQSAGVALALTAGESLWFQIEVIEGAA